MLRLIIFLILLIASVWLGLEIARHPGYLLMVYQPWMVQMPLWFALLSLVIFFVVFYLLIDSMEKFQFAWFRLKSWLRLRREHQSYSKTQHGLINLIEGYWKKAESLLLSGTKQSFEPLMNYLGAAKAAHELGQYERRDNYIQTAYHLAPQADLAIGLVQAELQLSQNQLEQAQATLNRLHQSAPYHPRVLQLLEKVYVRLADWKNLLALLPNLRKAKVLDAKQAEQFEKNIYGELFQIARTKNAEDIHHLWQSIPRATKKNPEVVYAYVKELEQFPETANDVEKLIRKTLKNQWQPELANLYGQLIFNLPQPNFNRHLVVVGAWLKMYGPKKELLLTLAKLCTTLQLWGKAKDYYNQCLALGPNAQASLEYGKLLEHLGDTNEALQKYREGLAQLAAENDSFLSRL